LKANNLMAVEHVVDVSARLIVNQAALKLKRASLQAIIAAFENAIVK
jgi:ATP phosphoribosyltransferase